AEAAARALGVPVALKAQSPDIPHKAAVGALALDLATPANVRAAFERVLANALDITPDILGVLVQPMAPAGREVILGVTVDDHWGGMLMVGIGGTHVEVIRDTALAPVPLDVDEARVLIGRLKGARWFEGTLSGVPPADLDALADLMVRLSQFASDHADEIAELDLNPVLVHPRGHGVTIIDALIVRRRASDHKQRAAARA